MCEDPSPFKKRKVGQQPKLESIILECRSVRIGTLRRMVTKPVVVRFHKPLSDCEYVVMMLSVSDLSCISSSVVYSGSHRV